MYTAEYDSPLGRLLLSCTDHGLTGIFMNQEAPQQQDQHPILSETIGWLDAYFRGESLPVKISLTPEGTVFQQQVWNLLLNIPYGETRSYGWIAREMAELLGKEKMSAQAVGQAVGRNPISILIPCHRVVGVKGQLTGYAGGLDKKIWLLGHEGQRIEKDIVL